MLLWLWWGKRNKRREEGRYRGAAEIAYLAAFQTECALKKPKKGLLLDNRQRCKWQKLIAGELKVNSDGAFDINRKDGGWGFVIRD